MAMNPGQKRDGEVITIPVVMHTVPVQLPKETVKALQTRPGSIEIAVNRDGDFFWSEQPVDAPTLLARLKTASQQLPQPKVHVRSDEATRYEFIGRVITACERAGIAKVSFITQPPARGG